MALLLLSALQLQLVLLPSALGATAPAPPQLPDAIATSPAGTFKGFTENGTNVWRGIPYADPPVGKLRWMPTVKKAPLDEPLETKSFGADCAQLGPGWPSLGGMVQKCNNPMMGCPNMTWSNLTKEDCLFLNVYAPAATSTEEESRSTGFPVVVYFPAGAFQWGAGNDKENNGYHKSATPGWKDTVFVSANYRTGIFGFLASPALSKRSGVNSSGLFGVHDQTMVLKWVKENIAAFGGDPNRVMIFGESAGATSMSLHLVMSENQDLYHAVAIDSGAFNQWAYRSWDDAMDIWDNVTRSMGCDAWAEPLNCMLTKTKAELLTVSDAYYGNETGRNLPHPEAINGTQWGPVVDGVLLPQSPMQMLAAGQVAKQAGGKKVPVLMGSNADEGTTFLSQGVSSAEELADWAKHIFGPTIGVEVAKFYSDEDNWDWIKPTPDNPQTARQSWDDAAQAVIGDFVMWCPARSAATALSKAGHTVFLYDFVHQPAVSVNWPTGTNNLGAFHGAEVPFVFGDTFELVGGEITLSKTMSQAWTNMASSGDPNTWEGPTAPAWIPPDKTEEESTKRRSTEHQGKPPVPSVRPPSWKFWWMIKDEDCELKEPSQKQCGAGKPTVQDQIADCKQTCMADNTCSGFSFAQENKGTHSVFTGKLKGLDCMSTKHRLDQQSTFEALFQLRPYPQPPPEQPAPHAEFPRNCSVFARTSECFNGTVYKSIRINITSVFHPDGGHGGWRGLPAPDLAKCCKACLEDAQCKRWFVPAESNGTECVLVTQEGLNYREERKQCIGASAPAWIPPEPQCHHMFAPMQPGVRVNFTGSVERAKNGHGGYHHRPVTRKIFEGETKGSCCSKCYLDFEGATACNVWTMPDPENGTCILYSGDDLMLAYYGPNAPSEPWIGATKYQPPYPGPPPPPAPCTTPQPAPVWPKWSVQNDIGVRFDVCNITLQSKIKKTRCDFWHQTVDKYWDIDHWIPANPASAHHDKQQRVRELFRTYATTAIK